MCMLTQISNVAATQCLLACSHGQDDLLKLKVNVGATQAGPSRSESVDLLGLSCTTISRVYRVVSKKKNNRREKRKY